MTREYALAPFAPENRGLEEEGRNETWTASTTLYSLDLHCEAPTEHGGLLRTYTGGERAPSRNHKFNYYMGLNGCKWPSDALDDMANDTIGSSALTNIDQEIYVTKKFTSFFVGYYSTDYSDWYLEGLCPKTANHTW
jgi:hypothetical protein